MAKDTKKPENEQLPTGQSHLLSEIETGGKTAASIHNIVEGAAAAAGEVTKTEALTVEIQGETYDLAGLLKEIGEGIGINRMEEINKAARTEYEQALRETVSAVFEFLNALREAIQKLPETGVIAADQIVDSVLSGFATKIQRKSGKVAGLFKKLQRESILTLAQNFVQNTTQSSSEAVASSELLANLSSQMEGMAKNGDEATQYKASIKMLLEQVLEIARAGKIGLPREALLGLVTEVSKADTADQKAARVELQRIKGDGMGAYMVIAGKAIYCYGDRGWNDVEDFLQKGHTPVTPIRILRNNETAALIKGMKDSPWSIEEAVLTDGKTSKQFIWTNGGTLHATLLNKLVPDAPDAAKGTEAVLREPLAHLSAPLSSIKLPK